MEGRIHNFKPQLFVMKTISKYLAVFVLLILSQSFNFLENSFISSFNIGALTKEAPAPSNNPITPEKVELGKKLFFDPILSANNKISCASCHSPAKRFADGLDRSNGFPKGIKTLRNAPTILNAAFNGIDIDGNTDPEKSPQFWDNRALSLEDQCMEPLLSTAEMKGNELPESAYIESLEKKVTSIEEYRELFSKAFSDSTVTIERITKAIATYERTLITPIAPFDRYTRGDVNAMNALQIGGGSIYINWLRWMPPRLC